MELVLVRSTKTEQSTISELYVNGAYECFILEDVDRGLTHAMPLSEIQAKKVHGKTAIPIGRYEIAITFSNRFKKYLPLLLSVPGYDGIRIHPGNTAVDTEGCLLPGDTRNPDMVLNSKKAFTALFDKLQTASGKEKIFIDIRHY